MNIANIALAGLVLVTSMVPVVADTGPVRRRTSLEMTKYPNIFISRKGPAKVFIITSYRKPESDKKGLSRKAAVMTARLRKILGQDFRLVTVSDYKSAVAGCEVTLRDWDIGEPNFQMICQSMLGGDSPIITEPSLPETPEEVLKNIEGFARKVEILYFQYSIAPPVTM